MLNQQLRSMDCSAPFEENNLLNSELTDAAAQSYETLSAQLAELLASEPE